MPELEVELVLRSAEHGRLLIAGDLVAATASTLRERATPIVESVRSLLVDLSDVDSVDEVGVAALAQLCAVGEANGTRMKLIHVPEAAIDLLAEQLGAGNSSLWPKCGSSFP